MGSELFIPRRASSEDESIAGFVGRRFGSEAVEYIAEPLLAGIHAGDVDRLSMRMLFPRLVEAEALSGSVIKALRRQSGHRSPDGAFRSFPNGLAELIEGLLRVLPPAAIQPSSVVSAVERTPAGYTIRVRDREPVKAASVLLAVPGFTTAALVRDFDADLAGYCNVIRYLSTATVALAFPREAVRHDLSGTGFVVPRSAGLNITAGAWISSKWPHRAPEGHVLLRAFLGGARDPDILEKGDEVLAAMALKDLRSILGITGPPELTRVFRWNRSSPQQEVGHAALMQQIEASLAKHPGLFVSAAGFRVVGIPDCVANARATAREMAAYCSRVRS
jgi:oxygen-dependent protoporphyrinogen oxidase